MKTNFLRRIISLAAAIAMGLVTIGSAKADDVAGSPAAPAPTANPYKVNYVPPAGQVEKLVKAGIGEDVIKAYVVNCPYEFNLTTDNLIHLQSIGVSPAVLTEMLNHDKSLRDAAAAMPQVLPPSTYTQTQPPPEPATYPATQQTSVATYDTGTPAYYSDLAPYGNWYYDNGYGWCWQGYPGLGYGYYPWGILGYGGWGWWPGRGWCWYPNGRFHTWGNGRVGTYAGGRYGGGYRTSYGGSRSSVGFHGGFNASVSHSSAGISHVSGGHSGGFSGGFGGGHGGGGHR